MRIIGQERIAEVFGVTPKTIVEWQEQGVLWGMQTSARAPSATGHAAG